MRVYSATLLFSFENPFSFSCIAKLAAKYVTVLFMVVFMFFF